MRNYESRFKARIVDHLIMAGIAFLIVILMGMTDFVEKLPTYWECIRDILNF